MAAAKHLNPADEADLKKLVPIDKGDVPRIIEIIGTYRRLLIQELKDADKNCSARDLARVKYWETMDEISVATSSTPIQQCYKDYCVCLMAGGASCAASLQACLDDASQTLPDVNLTDGKDRSI